MRRTLISLTLTAGMATGLPVRADETSAAPAPVTDTPAGTASAPGAGAGEAEATPDPAAVERAKAQYTAGEQAYLAGNYPAARQAFEVAYQLTSRPALLYNLARVSAREGRRDLAVDYLHRYLRTEPADAEVVREEFNTLDPEPSPSPPPAPPPSLAVAPAPERPRPAPWADGVLLGLGGAGLLAGAGVLGAGLSVSPAPGDAAGAASSQTMTIAGAFLLAGGAVMAVSGGVLLVVHRRSQAAPRVSLGLVPLGGAAGLGGAAVLGGRFY